MRILVVTPWFPTTERPTSGLFVRREVEALAERHDVHVLHLDWQRLPGSSVPLRQGVTQDRVLLSRADPRSYLRARSVVRAAAADVDLVHSHALTLLLPWISGRLTTRPWVHTEHFSGLSAPETLSLPSRLLTRVLARALRRPDAVIAESSRLAHAIQSTGRKSVDIVACVVPNRAVRPYPDGERLKLSGVGGVIPRKGPLVAIDAVARLVDRGVDVELSWAGAGAQLAESVAHAAALGVSDRVNMLGPLDADEVAATLDDSHMFILPTLGDNFCVVVAEALVAGRPIVSGDKTGAVDYAGPAVSRFVATHDGDAFADAVLDLRAATRDVSPAEVSATVANRFTPDTVSTSITTIYDRVAAARM